MKNSTPYSIIRFHQLIARHAGREVFFPEMRSMCPRLQSILLPDRLRKAATPFQSRIRLDNALNRRLIHQLGITTHIIKNSCKLNQRPYSCQRSSFPEVLMPDHGFCHVLGLFDGRGVRLQESESEEAAIEFKGQ
jgi:hypothetical protein